MLMLVLETGSYYRAQADFQLVKGPLAVLGSLSLASQVSAGLHVCAITPGWFSVLKGKENLLKF